MGGEFVVKIDNLRFNRDTDLIKPYDNCFHSYPSQDLTLNYGDESLHICGENDFPYLLIDALEPLMKYASLVCKNISDELHKARYKPKAILLGKNEFRAMDFRHRLTANNEPFITYSGIPVVRGKYNNGIELLGEDHSEDELPFK